MNADTKLFLGGLALAAAMAMGATSAPAATINMIHTFGGAGDGADANAMPIFDSAGNLYGTTLLGGASGWGTVYRLSPSASGWQETILYSFTGAADGSQPQGSLAMDQHGNLYGTTSAGGPGGAAHGYGVVFELSPTASGPWTEKVLHTFANAADGSDPCGGLTFDAKGNLYGTASSQATGATNGSVFQLTPKKGGGWTFHVLSATLGNAGFSPLGGVVIDAGGNLYSATSRGGPTGYGSIFELSPTTTKRWKLSVLHSFNGKDGALVYGGLSMDASGNLYGTTFSGSVAANRGGVVWELSRNSVGALTFRVLAKLSGAKGSASGFGSALYLNPISGDFFTTTQFGGSSGGGDIVEVANASGRWHTVSLGTAAGGFDPVYGAFAADSSGHLYGASNGGVFELIP